MEVLHGDIRITLSDQEAIRGLQRTRAQVKRGMRQLEKERAIISIEGDLKGLDRDLKRAKAQVTKLEGTKAAIELGLEKGDLEKLEADLKEAQLRAKELDGKTIDMRLNLENNRQALADLKKLRAEQEKRIALIDRERAATDRAVASDKRASVARAAESADVAKLQKQYDKLNISLARLRRERSPKFYTGPEERMRFNLDEKHITEQMVALRARLAAMNVKPVEIPVDLDEKRALEKLAGIGNIGTRIGPFSGTLKEFTRAGLVLGPILTGLLGSTTALAGAIGTGLTGALGIGAGAFGAFGLSLGGVGALTRSLFRDFKNLNTMQNAYHVQVLKTGANSDKAKTKLQEFNHALGAVSPTTRAAFDAIGKLQDRWRGLRKDVKPEFYESLGEAAQTANTDFGVFSRGTTEAFSSVSQGFDRWMKGLRSAEAQNVIFRLMENGNKAIPPLMSSLGHLGSMFGHVMASFSDHLPALVGEFDTWTGGLDAAAHRTADLDRGVDHLVNSFQDSLGVISAFGRVIIEMSRAAMGPGGHFLDDIAGGLNHIADTIHENPQPLRDFFGESIGTTKALFQTLSPLVKLFMEFSTILRPATNAVLSIVGPVADLVQALAGFGPIRMALQAWATMWLFKRTFANGVLFLTGAVKDLSGALRGVAGSAAAAGFTRSSRGLTAAVAARSMPVVGRTGVPVTYAGRNVVTSTPTIMGGVSTAERTGAAVAREGGILARGMSIASKGVGALSMGLLGVSAPVAAVGAAAIGAAIGIKHLHDAAEARARQEGADSKTLGVKPPRSQARATQNRVYYGGYGSAGDPSKTQANAAAVQREANAFHAAAMAVRETNGYLTQSYDIQRDMVSTGSQLANSQLMVEQAEKAYAAAVKDSGKNSLEARMALQQLRDARTQEGQAAKTWGEQASTAGTRVKQALAEAGDAYRKAIGTRLENRMAENLDHARNAAAVFEVNMRRAKKGMDIFSGAAVDDIGRFLRKFGEVPGVKKVLVQADTAEAAGKLSKVIATLVNLGQRKTVTKLLADAKNPDEALRRLNGALDKWENRHSVTHLEANKQQAERTLASVNQALTYYGNRKPESLLKARDEAKAKIAALQKQLDYLDGKSATVTANVHFHLPSNFTTDATGGYSGSGDGTGEPVPNLAKAVQKFAENNPDALSKLMMGAGGLGNAAAPGGTGLNAFNGIARRFGLTIGSGFRPGSITTSGNLSMHAMGRARDFPGPPAQMLAFARFMAMTYGSRLAELIHTPLGYGIKNGHRVPLSYWGQAVNQQHYSHVHVAMAKGGKVKPGRYTQPHVLFAEEPGHPEYFISTNPRDKKRSAGLVQQAAAEIGMTPAVEPFRKGGRRYRGLGGMGLSGEQQSILQTAVSMARAYHAPAQATRALLAALMDESHARNLTYGDASSTGPLQLLSSTARSLGVNPRNVKGVIRLFLTHGFYGHGGAISLAKRKGIPAAQIAHLVQGNAGGATPYKPFLGFARKVLARTASGKGDFSGGGFPGGGAGGHKPLPKLHGARNTMANRISMQQAAVDAAAGTSENFSDDINSIFGYDTTTRVPVIGGQLGGWGVVRPKFGRPYRNVTTHHTGMIGLLHEQTRNARKRRNQIKKALRGKLTKPRRQALLGQLQSLNETISGNRSKIKDLRTTGAAARFERRMKQPGGPGSLDQIGMREAKAESTTDLNDDLAAVTAEQGYYQAREKWAKKRGDLKGATEARQNYNAATAKIKDITDSMRNDKFATDEAWINWSEGQATLTGSLQDDFKAATDALSYWQGRVTEAVGRGDVAGQLQAAGNVQSYTQKIKSLSDDMKRLPLERDAALAALTDDTKDDVTAAKALQAYWAGRLADAKKTGDLQGQIDAAGNLKSLNDEIKAASDNIAVQMVLLSQARQDLFKSFGSNFLPTMFQGAPAGTIANGGTTINLTVNGASLGPDPHTWSQNVAWELQAAV